MPALHFLWHMAGIPAGAPFIEIIADTNQELIDIAENLGDEEEVDLGYLGKIFRFPKRFFLVHALAHSIEHRTEVKAALGHIGVETPDLDGWPYAFAMGYGAEVE